MIKYTTSQWDEAVSTADEITGFMVELWNEYGNISCRTILTLPESETDIRLWFYDSVVAIPTLNICFRTPKPLTYARIFNLISQDSSIRRSMASALAATVMVMESVTQRECEHCDMTENLAEHSSATMDFTHDEENENSIPF